MRLFIPVLLAAALSVQAQGLSSLVITTEAPHGQQPPVLQREDVTVVQGKDHIRTTALVPLKGEQGGLQLYILIDDGTDSRVSLQFNDLRQFIAKQPSTTKVSIGYIRNGSVQKAEDLRLPSGPPGIAASPYTALSELVKKWPQTTDRREVLLISSGIDLYHGPGPDNPYLQSAISDCQKAGVIVYSIYYGAEGHMGHNFWRLNWGQSYLSQLSDETGGEAYWQGNTDPVSFGSFLDDLNRKLGQQYRLSFEPRGGKGLEHVKLITELKHVEILAADRALVSSH